VSTLFQFFTVVVLGWAVPRWTIITDLAVLAMLAGDAAEEQWTRARHARRIQRRIRHLVQKQKAGQEPVTLIRIRKMEDNDEYPS
jgi:hypothetical protein